MTDQVMSVSQATDEPPHSKTSIMSIVNRIAGAFGRDIGSGDIAMLRRMDLDDLGASAFWRIISTYVPADTLPNHDPLLAETERKWAIVLNALAILAGLHQHNVSLGAALAHAGFSELRFVRLLRARDATLGSHVRSAASYLASKGQSADCADLALLVFSDAEPVRRKLARDYYYNGD